MKYYIITGEASGDLHGSNLMKALSREDPQAAFRVWGGDRMNAAGGTLVRHYRDLAFMGFVEVFLHIRTILRNIAFCKKDILQYQPDALILIDYPGFNLRIAKWAHQQGIRVFYYISPQLWAWHSSRVNSIKRSVDHLFVILPFEKDFYRQYQYDVEFVGHPLLDVVENFPVDPDFCRNNGLSTEPVIALLPGSRQQEISRMLEVMLQVVDQFPDYQFVIAGAPSIPEAFYKEILKNHLPENAVDRIHLLINKTYPLLQHARAALVTSGTATLETALFRVPQVVCYKGNKLSYYIARKVVNVSYISLVNLILDRLLVKELIQDELTPENLKTGLTRILQPSIAAQIREGYQDLREKLGSSGASERTAKLIIKFLT